MTGEQLHQLGGVAAVLRFPLEIDDVEEEDVLPEEVGTMLLLYQAARLTTNSDGSILTDQSTVTPPNPTCRTTTGPRRLPGLSGMWRARQGSRRATTTRMGTATGATKEEEEGTRRA